MQTKVHVRASQDEKRMVHHLFIYFCRLQPKYIPTNLKAIMIQFIWLKFFSAHIQLNETENILFILCDVELRVFFNFSAINKSTDRR